MWTRDPLSGILGNMGLHEETTETIRMELARRRWTVKELSQRAGIVYQTLNTRMNDEPGRVLTLAELERIAGALGVVARVELCAARDSNPEPADSRHGGNMAARCMFALAA